MLSNKGRLFKFTSHSILLLYSKASRQNMQPKQPLIQFTQKAFFFLGGGEGAEALYTHVITTVYFVSLSAMPYNPEINNHWSCASNSAFIACTQQLYFTFKERRLYVKSKFLKKNV